MKSIVSKRYVKAIMDTFKEKDLENISEFLRRLKEICKDEKVKEIIKSPTVSSKTKEEFILGLFENLNERERNFIKLLGKNNRFDLISEIYDLLKKRLVSIKNEYIGVVYSNHEISKNELAVLEKSFSDKFNSKINLEYEKNNIEGIKIDISDLGVEINFSMDKLKSKLNEYILQAI